MMNHFPPSRYSASVHFFSFLAATCLALPAFAADADRGDPVSYSDIRGLRMVENKPSPAIDWFGSLGTTYVKAQDGSKFWLSPFFLQAGLSRNTTLSIEGDGFAHTDIDGNKTQGFSNVALLASHVVYRDDVSRVRLGVGAIAPGSGGIGSVGAKQRVSASYARQLSTSWAALASGRLTRRNQLAFPDDSRIEQFGRLQTSYSLDRPKASSLLPRALILGLERSYRRGPGGSSQATAAYEFPLSAKLGASVGFTRGLTAGLRDNTFAFDLLFGF